MGFNNNKHAGASTTTLPGAKCLYLAVRCEDSVLGVIGIYLDKTAIDDFENNLLMAILNEGAMALEKEASNSKNVKLKLKRIKKNYVQIYYALFLMICVHH